jgi:putative membrane protein
MSSNETTRTYALEWYKEEPTMMGGYGMMAGMGWLGILLMALFWIGVILLVVWGLSNAFPGRQQAVEPDAEEILKRRYARGEISREEYVQASETLHVATR